MILNEITYFSNIKELDIITSCFASIKDKLKINSSYNPNGSKDTKLIEKTIASLFNFERIDLHWVNLYQSNAWTFPVTGIIPLTKGDLTLTQDSKGFHFKNSKNVLGFFTMDVSLFTLSDLTPREATAVLLHEIGHNFYTTNMGRFLRPMLVIFDLVSMILRLIHQMDFSQIQNLSNYITTMFLNYTKPGRIFQMNVLDFDKDKLGGAIRTINDTSDTLIAYISQLVNLIINLGALPIGLISFTASTLVNVPINTIMMALSGGYKNEKFADNFATMYGFGSETASIEKKFLSIYDNNLGGKIIKKVPVVNVYYSLLLTYIYALAGLGDVHPTPITRIKDQKRYLEACLNDSSISPQCKKQIKKQIEDIEKTYEDIYNDKQFRTDFRIIFATISKNIGLSDEDWKELIFKTRDYDYNKVFFKGRVQK